ncbi:MAG: hypothetical protein IJE25_07495 [Clostridia bacterium]|nr:hypothetical protein [Clostridia bacterium]
MKKRLSLVLLSAVIAMSALFCAMFAITSSAAAEKETVATFELGANGAASHSDGSSKTSYTETVNGYTLSVTGGSQFYTGARDAKGNSCFKLGSSKNTGSFSFTVPEDISEVIIYAAGYKQTAAKITVNDVSETISTLSDNGAYTAVEVDTTTNKTVTFSTASGGVRCMVNSIVFKKDAVEPDCQHTNTTTTTVDATKTEDGSITVICDECGYEVSKEIIPALGCKIDFVVPEGAIAPTHSDAVVATMPEAVDAPDGTYAYDYVFVGWAKNSVSNSSSKPTLYAPGDKVTLTGDTTFYAVYSYMVKADDGAGSSSFRLKDISSITTGTTVIITVTTSDGTVYAMLNSNGTGSAPTAVKITVENGEIVGEVNENLQWYIENDNGDLSFYLDENKTNWLYCTNGNNGVRVGTNTSKIFSIDSTSGYLKHTGTSRYVGVYVTNPDWRCYTSVTSNIANQTLGFYALTTSSFETQYTTVLEAGECSHSNITTVKVDPTCTEEGSITHKCNDCGREDIEILEALGHDYSEEITKAPTCEAEGEKTYTCSACEHSYTEAVDKINHNFVDGKCDMCGKVVADAEFKLGDDGNPSHSDGSEAESYEETDGEYRLVISDGSKFYCGARDALGNSCLKLGTNNAAGKFTIIVPDNVGKVVIYVAGYKKTDAKISVNGTEYTVTEDSDNGEYCAITVYTYSTKTVEFTTLSGGYRALINSIEFYDEESAELTGASLNAGKDLTLKYKVSIPEGDDIANYRMVFTMNNKEYVVTTYTVEGDKYVFSFTGIAPQDIADLVNAYLYKADSEEAVAEKLDYSVVEFAKDFVEQYGNDASYADYLTLLGNLLVYGQAAKDYTDYKVDEEIEPVAGLISTNDKAAADASVRELTQNVEGADATFAGVGVRFDYVNRIYVRYEVRNDAEARVKAMMGDTELELELIDGKWYTPALTATQFDETVTFTLSIDGEVVQTLTYSVNSYVVAKQGSTNSEVANLVVALYNYGTAAEKIAQSAQ